MGCILNEALFNKCSPPVGGVQNYAMWYKYQEWLDMEAAGNITRVTGVITNIINTVGVQAFRMDVPDETALILGATNRKVDGGVDSFDHTANMAVTGTSQEQKNLVEFSNINKVVIIVLKKDGKGEVYGDKQGMESQASTYAPNDPALGATVPLQLATSPRTAGEPNMPADIFDTDAATTKTLIEGLNVIGV